MLTRAVKSVYWSFPVFDMNSACVYLSHSDGAVAARTVAPKARGRRFLHNMIDDCPLNWEKNRAARMSLYIP